MLAVLVAAFFASERLADEAQRFLIFKGKRKDWGWLILVKSILQMAGASMSAVLLGPDAAYTVVGLLIVGNLIAYGDKLPWRYLPTQWQAWKAGVAACLNQRLFW